MLIDDLEIRLAVPQDADALLRIYAPYVKLTDISFEYIVPDVDDFAARIRDIGRNYPYFIACLGKTIIGYTYADRFRKRPAYDWTAETSIYLDHAWQGRGIGGLLYEKLEQALARQNVINLIACITYPNAQSIAFHQKMNYQITARFSKCGFKLGEWRDILWMEKTLCLHPASPKPFIPYPQLMGTCE